MKGFNLSKDYVKLYDLIKRGYRIPAWILYSDKFEKPIFDIVEVKIPTLSKFPSIGTRGRGYETFENSEEAFVNNCESLHLKFIVPEGCIEIDLCSLED
ncbi:hypothetical protein [Flavobacterium sp.]|uniref:hypothetical protein n=1 Tax=Flavobacterium sp. TaxID=239 RepID=UPI003D6A210B